MGRTKQTSRKSSGGKAPKYAAVSEFSRTNTTPSNLVEKEQQPTDLRYNVTHEGTLYRHYFPRLGSLPQEDFDPKVEAALVADPDFSEKSSSASSVTSVPSECNNRWIGLLLASKFDGNSQALKATRRSLNLCLVLDVSGSMGMPFEGERGKTKLRVAQQALLDIGAQLKDDDKLSVAAFCATARTVIHSTEWSKLGKEGLSQKILSLRSGGGTAIANATKHATSLLGEEPPGDMSSRLVIFTDMMVGESDGTAFCQLVRENASKSCWTTVIVIGHDLEDDTIAAVSHTPGCNYASVATSNDFSALAEKEFAFWVTPIAFNISLRLSGATFIEGFGSPEAAHVKNGETEVKFASEFPSLLDENGNARGAILPFKINTGIEPVAILVEWEDSMGISYSRKFSFSEFSSPPVESPLRKAVLLVHFTSFLKKYLESRNADVSENQESLRTFVEMRNNYPPFTNFFVREANQIPDPTLSLEIQDLVQIAQDDDIPLSDFAIAASKGEQHSQTTSQEVAVQASKKKLRVDFVQKADRESLQELARLTGISAELNSEDLVEKLNHVVAAPSECCICMTSQKEVLLLPCRHACICKSCSSTLDSCPVCRKPIESKIDIFIV